MISVRTPQVSRRRRVCQRLARSAREDLNQGRVLRPLVRLAVGLLWLSPNLIPALLVPLLRSRYFKTLVGDELLDLTGEPWQSTGVRPPRYSGPEVLLGASKACLEMGLISESLRFRVEALRRGARTTATPSDPHDLLGDTRGYLGALPPIEPSQEADWQGESRFREMVTGRRILLIGGAIGTVTSGQAACDPDTVVRLKFFGANSGWIDGGPVRTDIAYYVAGSIQRVSQLLQEDDDGNSLFPDRPKLAVFISAHRQACPLAIPIRYRVIRTPLLQGSTQIGQRAILDLLGYRPGALHVVGFDGYLSGQVPHRFRRELSGRTSVLSAVSSGSGHDLFGNRQLLKSLRSDGALTVDDQTAEYLDMSDHQYACELDLSLRLQYSKHRDAVTTK